MSRRFHIFLPSFPMANQLRSRILYFLLGVASLIFFCEVAIFYLALLQCRWPDLGGANVDPYVHLGAASHRLFPGRPEIPLSGASQKYSRDGKRSADSLPGSSSSFPSLPSGASPLRIMFLSDTHLMTSSRVSQWMSSFTSDWNMERAFQAAMFIHSPEVVFVLGDLSFSESSSSTRAFSAALERHIEARFKRWNQHTQFYFLLGQPHPLQSGQEQQSRSQISTGKSHVFLWSPPHRGLHFVMLNSLMFQQHTNRCVLHDEASHEVSKIARRFMCLRGDDLAVLADCSDMDLLSGSGSERHVPVYSRPILLLHLPTAPDACTVDKTVMKPTTSSAKSTLMRFLPYNLSLWLQEKLQPRLIINSQYVANADSDDGFTTQTLSDGVEHVMEQRLRSFSWQDTDSPSFLLMKVSANNHAVIECQLPRGSTVRRVYFLGGFSLLLWLLWPLLITYARTWLVPRSAPFLNRTVGRSFHS